VALTVGRLGSVQERRDDYEGARLLYQRALALAAKSLGADHPTTLEIKGRLDRLPLKPPWHDLH
jgi:hypothetical protein